MHDYTKYFQEQTGFKRFINKLYQKYKSLSKFSGTVKLENLSEDEASVLTRFFGKDYKQGETITISIKKFVDVMNNSKYEDFDINTLVEEYLGVNLITNKEEKDSLVKNEEMFYKSIINDINTIGTNWLNEVVTKKNQPYKLLQKRYNKNKLSLKKELLNIIKLIDNLPKQKVLLPIYASMYTTDPHYLDLDNNHSNLFFYALAFINKTDYPNTREAKIKLLSENNIEIDNLSNYALTYNLLSDKECINQFANNQESLIMNIQNIIGCSYFDTSTKKVFIFENPSILTEIMAHKLNTSVIISGGFPNISVHLLIEKLIESGNKIYYNGDFDPEGLLIANKLKEKYHNNLVLFCYDKIDYNNCVSKKVISTKRLKMLDKINDEALLEIKNLLEESKLSAYQENNKERIITFVKSVNQ